MNPRIDIAESDEVFVKELIRQKHVMVVPGSGFGPGTKHFRIVFLPDENTLTKAYAAIGEFRHSQTPRRGSKRKCSWLSITILLVPPRALEERHATGCNLTSAIGSVARLALLWEQRRFLFHGAAIGLVASKSDSSAYTSTIPPDQKGNEWPRCYKFLCQSKLEILAFNRALPLFPSFMCFRSLQLRRAVLEPSPGLRSRDK
jgi:hypothetical protein